MSKLQPLRAVCPGARVERCDLRSCTHPTVCSGTWGSELCRAASSAQRGLLCFVGLAPKSSCFEMCLKSRHRHLHTGIHSSPPARANPCVQPGAQE